MTQYALIKEWIKEKGFIIPAQMSGRIFYGVMFGSEVSKRCRELRARGELVSKPNGKFEEFRLNNNQLAL